MLEPLVSGDPRRAPAPLAQKIWLGLFAVLATALFLQVLWPFRAPIFLAAVLAAVLQRPLEKVVLLLRGRRRTAAALVTAGVLLVIVLPLASIAGFAAHQAVTGFQYVRDTLGVTSVQELKTAELPPPAQAAVDRTLHMLHLTRAQVQEGAGKVAARAEEIAPEVLKDSGRLAFHTVLMLLAFYFLLVDGRRVIRWLWSVSPLQAEKTEELLREFHDVASGSIIGTVASAVIQGVLAGIGFAIFGVPHAFFFGLLTAIASFIPVIGTAIVWVPAVGLLALSGHSGAAIGLTAWCAVGVVGVEHIGKPLLLRATSGGEMHTGLMFLALLGGLEAFGLLGVILGPLIVSFFISLMRMIERDASRPVELN
jgi:predicted PurR-regulated permease PerM